MAMTVPEIQKFVKDVDGWLTDREGEALYDIARRCTGRGAIVEIGSWKGKSTIWLGNAVKAAGLDLKIYAIDPHMGSTRHRESGEEVWTFDQFKENIKRAGVEDVVEPILKTSEEAAKEFDQPVEMIFIDGDHTYDFVKTDYEKWFPKVINGGWMLFHDTIVWDGPKKVVKDHVYTGKRFKDVGLADSLTFGQKVAENEPGDRIKNRYVLFLKDSFETARKTRVPRPIRQLGKKVLKLVQ